MELERWRRGTSLIPFVIYLTESFSGETVTKEEQANLQDIEEVLPTTQSSMSLSTVAATALSPTTSTIVPSTVGSADTRSINADEWEKERSALYQQLDEKVSD
jgi:hypothetical protein